MTKKSKYQQVEDYIKKEIAIGNLKIGDQIMTEEQLCKQFNFSRMTINKALNHLSDLGYIERISGKGSFVTTPHLKKNTNNSQSFSEDMRSIGLMPGARLISYEILHGRDIPQIAEKLGLTESDLIHYFVRLRTGNETPIAISYTYVSAKVIPAIDVNCLNHSFYAFVDSLGLKKLNKEHEFRATLPTHEQSKLLKAENIALLCSSHLTYTITDGKETAFEYVETYYNGDMYTYSVEKS